MKEIPLTQGQVALVDNWWFERLNKRKWYAQKATVIGRFYACSKVGHRGPVLYMHREIMNPFHNPIIEIDHKDREKSLDNRECNLRISTTAQNQWNAGPNKRNTSGFKGVCWAKREKKWKAMICVHPKRIFIGYFHNLIDAAVAYNKAALKYHGEFAYQNCIKSENL